jgi:hypothetical protein
MQHNLNNDLGEIEIELDQMSVIFNINSLFFFCILTLTIDYKKTDYSRHTWNFFLNAVMCNTLRHLLLLNLFLNKLTVIDSLNKQLTFHL